MCLFKILYQHLTDFFGFVLGFLLLVFWGFFVVVVVVVVVVLFTVLLHPEEGNV